MHFHILRINPLKVTMQNLPFEEEPNVEIDARKIISQDIEDKTWDQSTKTLTFQAKHFTSYKAVARTPILFKEQKTSEKQQTPSSIYPNQLPSNVYNLSPVYIFLLFFEVIVILIIAGALYLIWQKRKKGKDFRS